MVVLPPGSENPSVPQPSSSQLTSARSPGLPGIGPLLTPLPIGKLAAAGGVSCLPATGAGGETYTRKKFHLLIMVALATCACCGDCPVFSAALVTTEPTTPGFLTGWLRASSRACPLPPRPSPAMIRRKQLLELQGCPHWCRRHWCRRTLLNDLATNSWSQQS